MVYSKSNLGSFTKRVKATKIYNNDPDIDSDQTFVKDMALLSEREDDKNVNIYFLILDCSEIYSSCM
jgi:hypothetical protein